MKEKIRIGIIGTGFARSTQIPAFQSISEAEIVSVASGSLTNAERTARDFGIQHFTDNWRETVERKDVDLICITTPPILHLEMALFALENDKHILCEKPMAMNVDEAREMIKRAKESDILALIDHELRFTNGRQKAYKMLRSGDIGKVIHAKYHYCNAYRGDEHLPWSWWSDEKQGGGALGAIGSHVIDTFRWFLDAEISEIFCQLQTHIKQRPDPKTGDLREVTTDDAALMILRFSDSDLTADATANVSLSMVEAGNYRNAVEFFGTKGALRIEDNGEIFYADIKENYWNQIDVELSDIAEGMRYSGWSLGFMNFACEIVSALLEEKTEIEQAATFEDGLKIQEVLDAARESNSSGCKIRL